MKEFFLSANGVYEVCIQDYEDVVLTEEKWQEFADMLGEEFSKLGDSNDAEYEYMWNDAHNKVCKLFFK